MTHEEKINYMRIACNLCRIGVDEKMIDTIVSLYDLVLSKEGNATMKDTAKVESDAELRAIKRDAIKLPKNKKK